MSEQQATNPGDNGGDGGNTPPADGGFKPIISQEELNRIIGERVARAKPADYDDLKAKAAQLNEIEQATKTEAQRTAERIAKLEQELESTRTTALRSRVQAKFAIADEDADLFLTGTDEATLTKQAERLSQRDADRKKQGNRVPREGTSTSAGTASPWGAVLTEFDRQRQT